MSGLDPVELTRLSRVGEVALSPDGRWAAVVVQRLSADDGRHVSDLWRMPVDGSAPVRLTWTDSKDTLPRFRDDGALAFLSNRNPRPGPAQDGDEARSQVWVLPAAGGEPLPLTDEPLGVCDFSFTGDDLVLLAEVVPGVAVAEMRAVTAARSKHGPTMLRYRHLPVRHWDAWLPDTALRLVLVSAGGERRDLLPEASAQLRGYLSDAEIEVAPDGRRVAVLWTTVNRERLPESVVRIVELASGQVVDLGQHPRVTYNQPTFSPDGRTLVAVRSEYRPGKGDRVQLWRFDGADVVGTPVAPTWEQQPALHGFTQDGRALLCTADDEGQHPIFRVTLGGEVQRVVSRDHSGVYEHVCLAPDGIQVIATRSRQVHPPQVVVISLEHSGAPRALPDLSGFSAERGESLLTVESRWVVGDGGEKVQYFVIRPKGVSRPPVLFWIHGGPVGQFADGWHWRWSPMVAASAGYALILPNPRGSTGRSQAYIDGVFANSWGGACYRDLMAVADAVAADETLDGGRMVAMGGSFGGYMVNWIGGQTDRFVAIVSHAGIFGTTSFHGTTDYPGYFAHEMTGRPRGDRAAYARYSPDEYTASWKTPVMIIHGEKDYRVAISEALIMFEDLDARGVDAELVVFPDEGHWITRPRNIRAWYQTWMEFVARKVALARPSDRSER
jgi:dipeptidyl aminopeptidase/acylaminoacyl peptidase